MSKLDILGIEFIVVSIAMSIMLYKVELSKRIIDEEYEYIKKHRVFGRLTKYLTIGLFTICTGFFQKKNSVYFKRGLMGILSILIFIAVYMYAFRDVFF
ncbi:hypothetical protein [uncultured Veillonella sp.]|uniref:hypothetical protein n=1 Tax=uncultured Veillonella sp. TaxID=159268 RepID=UPI0025FBCF87|nr:hypothetical protein [uncultured Veillonella sp.]